MTNLLLCCLFDDTSSCLFTNAFLMICRWALWDCELTLALTQWVSLLFASLGAGLQGFARLDDITDFIEEIFLLFFNFVVSWDKVVSTSLQALLDWLGSLRVAHGDFMLWICALRSRGHDFFISGLVDCESGLWFRMPDRSSLMFALLVDARCSRCSHAVPYRWCVI